MPGTALERGMEHASDFRTLGKPGCNFQSRLVMLREPHAHGAQSPQAEIHVIRADAEAEQVYGLAQACPRRVIGGYGAEHDVRMAADIFCAGLDRQIDSFFEGLEIEGSRPGIVHQDDRARAMSSSRDRRDVLDLERK